MTSPNDPKRFLNSTIASSFLLVLYYSRMWRRGKWVTSSVSGLSEWFFIPRQCRPLFAARVYFFTFLLILLFFIGDSMKFVASHAIEKLSSVSNVVTQKVLFEVSSHCAVHDRLILEQFILFLEISQCKRSAFFVSRLRTNFVVCYERCF
jgi:hypothetical protein